MSDLTRIEDLTAEELRELLARHGNQHDEEEIVALKEFIEQVGGLDHAATAIEAIEELDEAA